MKETSIKDTISSGKQRKPSARALKPDNMLDTDSDLSESSNETASNIGKSKLLLLKPQSTPSTVNEDIGINKNLQIPDPKKEELKIKDEETEIKQDV